MHRKPFPTTTAATAVAALAALTGLTMSLTMSLSACSTATPLLTGDPRPVAVSAESDAATGAGPRTGAPEAEEESLPTPVHEERSSLPMPLKAESRASAALSEKPGERPILRNSEDFAFLENPAYLEPGARYFVEHRNGEVSNCSFGWMTSYPQQNRTFNLTAGHCGDKGDVVYVETDSGETAPVGEFVWQAYDGEEVIESGNDYALIEFYSRFDTAVLGTRSVQFSGNSVQLAGWRDGNWLRQNNPYMCRLGYRSGLSCGSFTEMQNANTVLFDNISDHGDSGGAVWAFDPSDPTGSNIYAVAVNSFGSESDATHAGGKTIAPVMEHFDLTIYD
ncbi:trypsin-like serine protease [Corynebacterium neomassiliense]|uniref:trypsin-like serine protease n=1 Tax=Corynebacterium neomassiliense TaxID=2079482 RepID=UPI001032162C|nr:trypsin-like serine protease [Corynebacterium neomassiliense]